MGAFWSRERTQTVLEVTEKGLQDEASVPAWVDDQREADLSATCTVLPVSCSFDGEEWRGVEEAGGGISGDVREKSRVTSTCVTFKAKRLPSSEGGPRTH